VAGFVGRDRGYRALGFAQAGALPLHDETPVRLGARVRDAQARGRDGWTLVVDDQDKPQGWLASGGLSGAALDASVTPELLNLGGTLASESSTLREALDAALSSPSGRGVIVREDGVFAGTIAPSEVLESIEARAAGIREQALQDADRSAGEP